MQAIFASIESRSKVEGRDTLRRFIHAILDGSRVALDDTSILPGGSRKRLICKSGGWLIKIKRLNHFI